MAAPNIPSGGNPPASPAALTPQDIANQAQQTLQEITAAVTRVGATLPPQVKDLVAATAALKGATLALGGSLQLLGKIASEGKETLTTLDEAQVELSKTIGSETPAALKTATEAFKDFNSATKLLGISFNQIRDSIKETNAQFKFTGIDAALGANGLKQLSLEIAKNANVLEESKLVDGVKTFSLQTSLSTKEAKLFTDQLIETAFKVGLPREALLNLSNDLLSSGVAFGQSKQQIEDLTFKTEAFGRALGTSGQAVKGQLESLQTIRGRVGFIQRLEPIAGRLGIALPISKLLSDDPAEQQEAISQVLSGFSQAYREQSGAGQRRAIFLATRQAFQSLPARAIQTALESGVDIRDAMKQLTEARRTAEAGISDNTRRTFATFSKKFDEFINALKFTAGQQQLKLLNSILGAITGTNGNTKKTNTELENLNENIGTLATAAVDAANAAANAVENQFPPPSIVTGKQF